MRIGMAQMDISWENIEDNKKKVEEFFQKAQENEVDCLVFPEMTLTGFSMNVEETGEKSEKQIHFFEEMSRKYEILTVFGYTEPVPAERLKEHPDWNHYYNRLGIVENGELKLNYAKIHPFSYGFEGEYYQGGRKLKSVEWKGTTLGAQTEFGIHFEQTKAVVSEWGDTTPYQVGLFHFAPKCGLYFICGCEEDGQDENLEPLLEQLGMTGIGGKVSSGYGKFRIEDTILLNEPFDDQTEWMYQALTAKEAADQLLLTTYNRYALLDLDRDIAACRRLMFVPKRTRGT